MDVKFREFRVCFYLKLDTSGIELFVRHMNKTKVEEIIFLFITYIKSTYIIPPGIS